MPLQIRRGSTAQRLTITPLPGELVYDTTTGQLYVGDGTTVGGTTTTGISLEDARDAAAGLLTSGIHSGITFTYNDALDRIDATVTIAGTGPFDGDINGSVFADDSTVLVDGTGGGAIKGPLNVFAGAQNRIESGAGVDQIGLRIVGNNQSYSRFDTRVKLVNSTADTSTDSGVSLYNYVGTGVGPRISFNKYRGTESAPAGVVNNDSLGDVWFISHDGGTDASAGRFGMVVEGAPTPSSGFVPSKFRFQTSDGSTFSTKVEISSTGVLKTDAIQNFTGTDLSLTATNIQVNGTTILNNRAELRFEDADGSNYVSLRSPAVLGGNLTFNLPSTGGSSLDVLYTDGAGNFLLGPLSNVFPGKVGSQIAIGTNAGQTSQGTNGIALGFQAGQTSQGNYSIAIGYTAGQTSQHANSVILNGGNSVLNSVGAGFHVNPVRNRASTNNVMQYDPVTKEISYTQAPVLFELTTDLYGSVFANDSTPLVDAIDGNLFGNKVSAGSFFQLPVYADDTARSAAIPSPTKGMMIMMEAGTTPAATNVPQVFDGTNWINL